MTGTALGLTLGLGLFCVTGAVKALEHGLGPVPAALMGMVTGIGGGIARDLLAGEAVDGSGDRDRGDDPVARTPHGGGDGGDARLALADGLRPAAAADPGERGGGEGGVLQALVHLVGLLPGEQHLGGGPGAHREL